MLALVRRADGAAITHHQTFLAADGRGKAPVDPPRLFPAGASPEGGGVWFGRDDPDREFVVAEGVESLLAAMAIYDAGPGAPPCPPSACALSNCRPKRGEFASSPTTIDAPCPPLATPIAMALGGTRGARLHARRARR